MGTLPFSGGYLPGDDMPIERGPGAPGVLPFPGPVSGAGQRVPIVSVLAILAVLYTLEHIRFNRGRKR